MKNDLPEPTKGAKKAKLPTIQIPLRCTKEQRVKPKEKAKNGGSNAGWELATYP